MEEDQLRQFMQDENLIPSRQEEEIRQTVMNNLRMIIVDWIKNIARGQSLLSQDETDAANATIIPFGSYGLGAYVTKSDIDAVCLAPCYASIDDFFTILPDILKSRSEVSHIHCIRNANVPIISFKFHGIFVDLPFARLQSSSIPKDLDPSFLMGIDETSSKSLSGVFTNHRILQLVPSKELFQSLLRCIKFWAKRRGLYGNSNGFLGGIHLAVLVAFVCRNEPNATTLSSLLVNFFKTFASWKWPTPVLLSELEDPATAPGLMPIQLPGSHQFCNSNITESTCYKITTEFEEANRLIEDYRNQNWKNVFKVFPYAKKYKLFIKINLSADDEDLDGWVRWVRSRFRVLLDKVEDVYSLCDPNPTEYLETNAIVFYWGLLFKISIDVSEIKTVQTDFLEVLSHRNFRGKPGRIKLKIVDASQLPDTI